MHHLALVSLEISWDDVLPSVAVGRAWFRVWFCFSSDGRPTKGMHCDRGGDSSCLPVYKSPFFALKRLKPNLSGDISVSWSSRDATAAACVAFQAGQ